MDTVNSQQYYDEWTNVHIQWIEKKWKYVTYTQLHTRLLFNRSIFLELLQVRFQEIQLSNVHSRVVVSVSTSRSRDGLETYFSNVSVSAKCGKVSVSVSSRTESQTSRSRLGLGPQRLVYKWTFKQIFQFLSFSYETNMSDIILRFIHSLVLYVFPFR